MSFLFGWFILLALSPLLYYPLVLRFLLHTRQIHKNISTLTFEMGY